MDSLTSATQQMSPAMMIVSIICSVVVLVVGIAAAWKIFTKAGKPGWHAIIPFLNMYDLFEICWGKGILFLLMLIPGVNLVISIILSVKEAKSFGKGTGFAIGLIFLPFIFLLILAFGSAQYIGPDGVPAGSAPAA